MKEMFLLFKIHQSELRNCTAGVISGIVQVLLECSSKSQTSCQALHCLGSTCAGESFWPLPTADEEEEQRPCHVKGMPENYKYTVA